MIKVSVMYANTPGARFNHEYYRDKHMPLVKKRLGDACLYYTVDKGLAGGAPGAPATYVGMCHIFCNSVESFQAAFEPHAKEIMADIPNYTDLTPVLQISEVVVERAGPGRSACPSKRTRTRGREILAHVFNGDRAGDGGAVRAGSTSGGPECVNDFETPSAGIYCRTPSGSRDARTATLRGQGHQGALLPLPTPGWRVASLAGGWRAPFAARDVYRNEWTGLTEPRVVGEL